jgi:hypothetical protein
MAMKDELRKISVVRSIFIPVEPYEDRAAATCGKDRIHDADHCNEMTVPHAWENWTASMETEPPSNPSMGKLMWSPFRRSAST